MNAPYGYRDLKNAAMDAKLHAREFHAVKDKDDYIVLDIENMRLIRLDKVELRVLTELRRNPIAWGGSPSHGRDPNFDGMLINTADDIEKIETAVEELLQADLVATSPYPAITPAEIEIYTKKLQEEYEAKSIFHISLNVTHKCNLHCVYCYGEDGSYGGPAVNMSEETARQAVDYLFRESGDSEKCSITLFGGEPLLNFPMVRFIINYAREEAAKLNKQIFFQMTTNGLLLDDEKTDYLIEENVGITFSMDGPKHIHDANRRIKNAPDKSSFDHIYPQIKKYIEKADKKKAFYCFRATLTGPSLMDIDAVQTFFKQFQPAKIHYDMAESKEPSNSAINENCMDAYMEAIKGEVEGVKQKELGEAHLRLFQGFLKSLERKEKILRKCISPGVTYIAVSPEGDVYPCHRFVGNKDTSLGNLHRGFDRNKWLEQYAKVNIYHSPVCSKCWARYMCGGMCTFNNYYLDGSLVLTSNSDREPVHCLQQKKIIEEAIRYYCYLSENYAETEIKEAITQEAVSEKSVSEESPTGEKEA